MEKEQVVYGSLPFFERIKAQVKDWYLEKKKEFKFPWFKLVSLLIVLVLIATVVLIVALNVKEFPSKPAYDKTGFVHVNDYTESEIVMENSDYKFVMEANTTHFTLIDKATGQEWKSNPTTKKVDTLTVYYPKSLGNAVSFGNYDKSIYYEGTKNYLFRESADGLSVEVLYEIGGKIKTDYTDFPLKISKERLESIYATTQAEIDRLDAAGESTKDLETALDTTKRLYIENKENGFYAADSAKMNSDRILNRLYLVFYTTCGYTSDDLLMDNALNGVEIDRTYPRFEMSLLYTLTNDGLSVKLVNDSIVDYETEPLLYVDILPYFGAASTADTGYTLIPDGSGVIIDYNNNRSYASPYEQRIYGDDLAPFKSINEVKKENINLAMYGAKVNDHGFVNIVSDGAESLSILSNNSTLANPYNQTYYRFYYRENDKHKFASLDNVSDVIQWTNEFNNSNAEFYITTTQGSGTYVDMAKRYQGYLVDKGLLTDNDNTNQVVLNLSLLGGYLSDENFIGFKYTKPRSLTNSSEVEIISRELKDLSVNNINVIYQGWSNGGIKSSYMGDIDYNNVIASKSELKQLQKNLNSLGISFYPQTSVARAYTDEGFNENKMAIRNIFGKVSYRQQDNPATLMQDADTLKLYTLKSSSYEKTLGKILKTYEKLGFKNAYFNDFGNLSYGSYENSDVSFRSQTTTDYINTMEKYANNINSIITSNPFDYALKYTDVALNIPSSGTNYQIVKSSVPFYQLVISGYIDYSGISFNLEDEYSLDYYKMKAIESLSNIAMTWSYKNTVELIESEYNTYYSTYYKNWIDKTAQIYKEMNDLGIYSSKLVGHEIVSIDGNIRKSIYENGCEIVFNYSTSNYNYNGTNIKSNEYAVVKEGN